MVRSKSAYSTLVKSCRRKASPWSARCLLICRITSCSPRPSRLKAPPLSLRPPISSNLPIPPPGWPGRTPDSNPLLHRDKDIAYCPERGVSRTMNETPTVDRAAAQAMIERALAESRQEFGSFFLSRLLVFHVSFEDERCIL